MEGDVLLRIGARPTRRGSHAPGISLHCRALRVPISGDMNGASNPPTSA